MILAQHIRHGDNKAAAVLAVAMVYRKGMMFYYKLMVWGWVMRFAIVLFCGALLLMPLVVIFSGSFQDINGIMRFPPQV